ncbi:MAG TPA: metal ABC transporter substrate-binding protein [Longimicrobiales bacterium]|nr:metal ABC transporter substrate-binding protein [Longimicrobiales bacterium]
MRHATLKLAVLALVVTIATGATFSKKLSVVATTPDLAALARAIGGAAIEVKALGKPTEDQHFVDAKPSLVVTLNRADVLIEGGAELELGWLPALLESARNSKIAVGAPGRIVANKGVRMMEIPTSFDRSRGDVHALGNPHFVIDPVNVKLVVAQIADRLAQLDPANASLYNANLKAFNTRLEAKSAEWRNLLAPYRGAKIVTYHKDFPYFAERYGFQVVENLEPKPGIAPSPSHLAKVISIMKATDAHVIIVQPYQNRKTAETVARQANAVVVDLAQQPGAVKGTDTYFDLLDNIVRTLANAFKTGK